MSQTAAPLPPPVAFTHAETLHAISLPPLATFLVALHKAEHLVKLNDILDRYRTPKSYHRVDVRLMESSELPPESPESLGSPSVTRQRRDSREPVFLGEGVNVEPNGQGCQNLGGEGQQGIDHGAEAVSAEHLALAIEPAPRTEQEDGLRSTPGGQVGPDNISLNAQATDAAPSMAYEPSRVSVPLKDVSSLVTADTLAPALHNTQTPSTRLLPRATTPPAGRHPLAPSGPLRRVRELRLDLRTLDAAALFALETWRRQELGLEKLELEVPDSIWYKAPTPSPSPPPVAARKRGRPPGRPRKFQPGNKGSEELEPMSEKLLSSTTVQVGAATEEALDPVNQPTSHDTQEAANSQLDQTIAYSTSRTGEQDRSGVTVDISLVPDSGSLEPASRSTADSARHSPTTTSPEKPSGPPSPDVLLNDAFNEKDDDDPEYIPPPSSGRRRGAGRTRKSAVLDASTLSLPAVSVAVTLRPAVEATAIIPRENDQQRRDPVGPKVSPPVLLQTLAEDPAAIVTAATIFQPAETSVPGRRGPGRPRKRPKSSVGNADAEIPVSSTRPISPELPGDHSLENTIPGPVKRRLSFDMAPTAIAEGRTARQLELPPQPPLTEARTVKRRSRRYIAIVEIPSKHAVVDAARENPDDEEWAFLKHLS